MKQRTNYWELPGRSKLLGQIGQLPHHLAPENFFHFLSHNLYQVIVTFAPSHLYCLSLNSLMPGLCFFLILTQQILMHLSRPILYTAFPVNPHRTSQIDHSLLNHRASSILVLQQLSGQSARVSQWPMPTPQYCIQFCFWCVPDFLPQTFYTLSSILSPYYPKNVY